MARNFNTDINGKPFSNDLKNKVWAKARRSSQNLCFDICGKPMLYEKHGDRSSATGWEIDHIKPVAKGGSDELQNLQPLNWETNTAKSDKYPWRCGE